MPHVVVNNVENIALLARARVNINIIRSVLVALELVGKHLLRFSKRYERQSALADGWD